jgi:hypothetical protein
MKSRHTLPTDQEMSDSIIRLAVAGIEVMFGLTRVPMSSGDDLGTLVRADEVGLPARAWSRPGRVKEAGAPWSMLR